MKFRTSFGFQLTCLVLIIIVPAALVTAYDFATSLSNKRDSSYAFLQSIANQCAHDFDGLVRSTAAFLNHVSDLVEALSQRRGALQPAVARILENHPEYANIRILDHHVFSNLISNAVKYSRSRPLPRVEIGCEESGAETVYYVRDNGIGFDMKYADKLTQVFQKLHPNYEGSGIGLAIVKRVLEKHGGRLWTVSAPGQGATFFFSLSKTPPPTTK